MSKLSMLSYLLNNGWKMVSQNYVIHEDSQTRPMDVVQAYVTQRHRERIAAYESAVAQLELEEASA
jgi:hypothetical protein